MKCSCRMRSTVALNEGDAGVNACSDIEPKGVHGGEDCEGSLECPNSPSPPLIGVVVPEEANRARRFELKASEAALSRRFVVPNALVDPERAEHTTATLFASM